MKNEKTQNLNLYQAISEQIGKNIEEENGFDLWETVKQNVDIKWKIPRKKNSSDYEIKTQIGHSGPTFIVKDIATHSYISLNEEEFFVWELIDGKNNMADICTAFFDKFRKLSNVPLIITQSLEEKNMLAVETFDIYDSVIQTQIGPFKKYAKKLSNFFLSGKILLKNIDGIVDFLYHMGGWIFFTPWVVGLFCIIIASGFWIFLGNGYFHQEFSFNTLSYRPSLVVLLILSLMPVVFHESAHAFACKKFGRKINRAGFMLYIGMPVLFVDTTDIWMGSRRERILVSLSGPFTDLLIGAICFLIHAFADNNGIIQLLPLVGMVAFIRCLYNFNPLLEFDGYYILMDVLDIPELRKKSFRFLKKGGLKKLFSSQKLSNQEYIFLFYGLTAGAYTYGMIFFMLYIWQTKIQSLVLEIWNSRPMDVLSQLLLIIALAIVLFRFAFILGVSYKKFKPTFKRWFLKLKLFPGYSKLSERKNEQQ